MKKHYLAILLSMLMSMSGIRAFAYDFEVNNADGVTIYYTKTSDTEVAVSHNDNIIDLYSNLYTGSVIIPESVTFNGITYNVTSIGNDAFHGCTGLKSVTISNSITSIGRWAFKNCRSLPSITIGSGVKSIDDNAFDGTSPLKVIWLTNTPPKGYTLLKGRVNYVSNENYYSGLKNVVLYKFLSSLFEVDGVKYVPVSPSERTCDAIDCSYNKLSENTKIDKTVSYKGVSLTIKHVKDYLCHANPFVKNATINTSLGDSAFSNCTALKEVTIQEEGSVESHDFLGCTALDKVTLLNKGGIGNQAFLGCTSLNTITIPNEGNIGAQAFSGCTGLKEVFILNQGEIRKEAFIGCTALQKAELGEGITTIGDDVFSGCSKLLDIVIPNSVSSIGENVFKGCSSLKSVKIGSGLYSIPSYAFRDCSSLSSVQIPQTLTILYDNAFHGCSGLKTVILDDSETELYFGSNGSNPLFASCPLDSVYIGRNITFSTAKEQGYSPFAKNKSLRSVVFTDRETEITAHEFYECSGLKNVTIQNKEIIGNHAFYCCSKLQSVEFGQNVKTISPYAFYGCSDLQNVIIPNSTDSVGDRAFANCSAIKSVKIGNGVKTISFGAFQNCSSLTDVSIGSEVSVIGKSAFDGCSAMQSIQIPQNVTSIGNSVFNGCTNLKYFLVSDCQTELNLGHNDTYIPGSPLFSDCPLDSVYIGRNIIFSTDSKQGYSPFYRNTKLRSIFITNYQTEISEYEFYGCTNLKYFVIGDGVTTIGNWAFSGCSSLDKLSIGRSVSYIGKESFSDCSSLTRLICKATIPPTCGSQALDDINKFGCTLVVPKGYMTIYQQAKQWKEFFFIEEEDFPDIAKIITFADANVKAICVSNWDSDGNGEISEDEAAAVTDLGLVFKNNKEIQSFIELEYFTGLTSIANDAFYWCSKLAAIKIPENVTIIGERAFVFCSKLTSINIPKGVTSIEDRAFQSCGGLTSITIPNSMTRIGKKAFHSCKSLTAINIPGSVVSIGENALSGCKQLTSITVEGGNPKYDSRNNCNAIIETETNILIYGCNNSVIPDGITKIADSAFSDYTELTSVFIPNTVSSIGNRAFSGCSGINSVIISEGVISIGNDAFNKCTSFNSLTIPNSVTSIGNGAFSECSSLTTVTIGQNVSTIGDASFMGCPVTSVTMRNSKPITIDVFTFFNQQQNAILYVPIGSKTAYEAADVWKEFKEIKEVEMEGLVIAGDANNDGKVDVEDVVAIVNKILGTPAENFNEAAADVTGDGNIDVEDVVAVVNIILGSGQQNAPAKRLSR